MAYSLIVRFMAVFIIAVTLSSCSTLVQKEQEQNIVKKTNPEFKYVKIKTSKGDITVQLTNKKTPITVNNFLRYVKEGHYKNSIFHRVIKSFAIQGGGFNEKMEMLPTHEPIINEAKKGNKNELGTIAMARTVDPNSARAQFFINLKNNSFLNYKNDSIKGYGYCVFGKVIKGMDVVNKIQNEPTHTIRNFRNVPIKSIVIYNIEEIPAPSELLKKSEVSKTDK